MATINLNIDPKCLQIETYVEDNTTHYRLNVKISEKEHNTVTLEDDGLYAAGDPATVGYQLLTPQIHGGIRVGYFSQWNLNQEGKNQTRISCNGNVHRTWTADDIHGTNLRGKNPDDVFRGVTGAPEGEQNIDILLPGDFIRIPNAVIPSLWDYYIITQVSESDRILNTALIAERVFDL